MMIQRYRERISGPLLDRSAQPPCGIDIHIEVPRVDYDKVSGDRLGEPSADIRARIEKAREAQRQRFAGAVGGADGNVSLLCNAEMPALAPQAVSPLRARGPNGAQVWGRRRCASSAGWTTPARACCARR